LLLTIVSAEHGDMGKIKYAVLMVYFFYMLEDEVIYMVLML